MQERQQKFVSDNYNKCVFTKAVILDDLMSDAATIAVGAINQCRIEWNAILFVYADGMNARQTSEFKSKALATQKDDATAVVLRVRAFRKNPD